MFLTVQSNHKIDFHRAYKRFEAWIAARPDIHFGTCSYACSLIHEMIHAKKMLFVLGDYSTAEIIDMLEALLNDFPPDYDPPTSGSFLY